MGRQSYEDSRSQPAENPERPPPKPGFAKNLQPSHSCWKIRDIGAFGEILDSHLFVALLCEVGNLHVVPLRISASEARRVRVSDVWGSRSAQWLH